MVEKRSTNTGTIPAAAAIKAAAAAGVIVTGGEDATVRVFSGPAGDIRAVSGGSDCLI